jgi:ribosome-associated protein YbcJ (S4-like RNA binding protein)
MPTTGRIFIEKHWLPALQMLLSRLSTMSSGGEARFVLFQDMVCINSEHG